MHKGLTPRPLASLVLCVLACAVGACGSAVATSTGPSPAKCAVTLAVPSSPVSSGGDTATVGVTTQPECAWSASSDAAWITGLAPSSGQGSAQLQMQIAANPDGTARQGDIVVNGQRGRIRQDAALCRFELSSTEQSVPPGGGTGTITFTATAGCAWSAQADAAWVVLTGGTTGTGTGSVAFAIATNPGTTTRTASIVVAGHAVKITQQANAPLPLAPPTSPANCAVSVSPRDVTFLASGTNSSSISVTAASSCDWSASADSSWISLTGRTSGTGNGTVTFSVASNNGAARSGSLTIGDQTIPVNQAGTTTTTCSYAVTPLTTSVTASGGAGPQITIDTQSGCAWSAASNATWLSITSAANGSGDASVSFSASANTGAARSGTLTVAGQTVTVSQPSASCSYTVPQTISISAGGSTGTSVSVTAASGCPWTATSNVSWISIASGASGSGSGAVTIAVAANSGAARSGTLTIAGQTVTVNQAAAAPCTYSLSSTTLSVAAGGGATGPVTVTTAAGCTWTATSNASWLSITAGASGTGNGTVSINAAANSGGARSGTLTVANQTVTVNQAAPPCAYIVTPLTVSMSAAAGSGTPISVSTASGCTWTATTTAGWITIVSGATGTGNGSVTYSVQANTGSARTGTLTVAGQSVTISQSAPCTYSISPPNDTMDKAGGTGTVSVTTQSGCTWTAVSNASWITITSGSSGTGNGAVNFTVAANTTGNERTGTLTIAGRTFTLTEKK